MGYKIQTNRHRPFSNESDWDSRKRLSDPEIDVELDAQKAIRCIRYDADLARIIYPMRAIDENGHIIASYEPENDMRLPGCRQRAIWRIAEQLCGRVECVGEKFWYDWACDGKQDQSLVEFEAKAEEQIDEDADGFWVDPEFAHLVQVEK